MKRLLVLVIALALSVVPVSASAPEEVTIISPMVVSPGMPGYGTFVAAGPAFDAGVICASGNVFDTEYRAVAEENEKFVNLFVHKLFVCDDGSGTFEMDLNVLRLPDALVMWRVTGGDGAYARLHGAGKLTGETQTDGSLIDFYTGKLHID